MSRIDAIFQDLRGRGGRALMPFVVGGHPARGELGPMLRAAERAGASIVEIGIPFSDPIADGPVIAAAMHRALTAGVRPRDVFAEVGEARSGLGLGLVAMVSVSLVLAAGGPREFVRRAAGAGFDGFIFPDAPLEESDPLLAVVREAGLSASLLVAPTTPPARAEKIVAACSGFVYLLARTGITGERTDAPDIAAQVRRLRQMTPLPLACGFGISSAEQVAAVVRHADAAIVGSALVRRLDEAHAAGQSAADTVERFVGSLAAGLAMDPGGAGGAASDAPGHAASPHGPAS